MTVVLLVDNLSSDLLLHGVVGGQLAAPFNVARDGSRLAMTASPLTTVSCCWSVMVCCWCWCWWFDWIVREAKDEVSDGESD